MGMSFEEAKKRRDANPIWSAFTSGYGGGAIGAVRKAGTAIGLGLAGKVSTRTGARLGTTFGKGAGKRAGTLKNTRGTRPNIFGWRQTIKPRHHISKELITDEYLYPQGGPSVARRGRGQAIKGTNSARVYRGDGVDRTIAKMRTTANQRVRNTTVQQGPPFGGATRRISPNPRASVKSKARREELARKKGGRLQGPKTASQQRVDELFGVGNRPL